MSLHKKLQDPAVVILDVRTPAEFASGHIAGAVNVDFESGSFDQDIQKSGEFQDLRCLLPQWQSIWPGNINHGQEWL